MAAVDHDQLAQLNRDYIDAVQHSNVECFKKILAADFRCSNSDGSLLDRQGFLEQSARSVEITGLAAHNVEIRIFGDCAIIHATTAYRDGKGEEKKGRYTDVWIKQSGAWLAISAHVTRG